MAVDVGISAAPFEFRHADGVGCQQGQVPACSPSQQCDLAGRIVTELEEEPTPEQIALLETRARELRRNPQQGIPGQQVRAELKQRLEKRRACHDK